MHTIMIKEHTLRLRSFEVRRLLNTSHTVNSASSTHVLYHEECGKVINTKEVQTKERLVKF